METNNSHTVPRVELKDFVDEGMHTTWLVHDTSAFATNPGPTSERDRLLHFGLTYQEWKALFFDVLGVARESHKALTANNPDNAQAITIVEFDENDPALKNYPALSRICGMLYDAAFEAGEVEQLYLECLQVKASTPNPVALLGLDKLIRICEWAKKLGLSIYLMAD